jgi:flagellar assembly protein FliH
MSREWSNASFAPVGKPIGFVPAGLFADAPGIAPQTLGEVARARRSGFEALDVATRARGGFDPGAGWAGTPAETIFGTDGKPPAPARAAEAEVLPPIDPDLVFAEGLAEGQRRAAEASAADVAACARLISGLGGGVQFDRVALAVRMRRTVLALVTQIVGEVGVDADRLSNRIGAAVNMLADVSEPARIHLHPDDLALVKDHLATNLAAVADPDIERGGFSLETLSATIEDGPTLWLEQLEAALDRVADPA